MNVEVFVPGPLRNPMNGSHGHWRTRAKWAKDWRERVGQALVIARHQRRGGWPWPLATPKRITFQAYTWNMPDSDAVAAMLKPCRDALQNAQVIDSDGWNGGHDFVYLKPIIRRSNRGVHITIDALPSEEP